MKKNISKKSSLVIALVMAVITAASAMPIATFAEEIAENNKEEVAVALTDETDEDDNAAIEDSAAETAVTEDSSEEVLVEDADSEDVTAKDSSSIESGNPEAPAAEENNSESPEEESIVEVTEETLIEEEPVVEVIATSNQSVHYNAIYVSGLNILNNNWKNIVVTVTNVKTGEVQEGYLEYQNSNALLGYLTSGSYMDTNSVYKIEAQVEMSDGEKTVVYGSSTGTASNGGGYSTISFKAEGSTTI